MPAGPGLDHSIGQAVRPLGSIRALRRERLEIAENRLARGNLGLQLEAVSLVVPREELIARTTEPLPDRLGSVLLDGPDGAPLGLELPNLRDNPLPVGRFHERFRLRAECILPLEVLRPIGLTLGKVGLAACIEAIAGRTKTLP